MGILHSPSKTAGAASTTIVHLSLPHPLSHPTHSHPTTQLTPNYKIISRLTTTPPHLPGPRTPYAPPTPYSSHEPTRDRHTARAAQRRPPHETGIHTLPAAHASRDRHMRNTAHNRHTPISIPEPPTPPCHPPRIEHHWYRGGANFLTPFDS